MTVVDMTAGYRVADDRRRMMRDVIVANVVDRLVTGDCYEDVAHIAGMSEAELDLLATLERRHRRVGCIPNQLALWTDGGDPDKDESPEPRTTAGALSPTWTGGATYGSAYPTPR